MESSRFMNAAVLLRVPRVLRPAPTARRRRRRDRDRGDACRIVDVDAAASGDSLDADGSADEATNVEPSAGDDANAMRTSPARPSECGRA